MFTITTETSNRCSKWWFVTLCFSISCRGWREIQRMKCQILVITSKKWHETVKDKPSSLHFVWALWFEVFILLFFFHKTLVPNHQKYKLVHVQVELLNKTEICYCTYRAVLSQGHRPLIFLIRRVLVMKKTVQPLFVSLSFYLTWTPRDEIPQ